MFSVFSLLICWNPIHIEEGCVCIVGLPRWFWWQRTACQCREHKRHGFDPWARKVPWRRAWQPAPGRSPGGGHGNLLQSSCLENPMDRGAWWPQSMGSQSWTWQTWLSMHTYVLRISFLHLGLFILLMVSFGELFFLKSDLPIFSF